MATHIEGIQPVFEPLKAHHFNSSWNWVRQDALLMGYNILHGQISTVDRDITARYITINRADDTLFEYMQYYVNRCDPSRGETYRLGKELLNTTGAFSRRMVVEALRSPSFLEFEFPKPELPESLAFAKHHRLEHGDKCDAWSPPSGEWFVKFKKSNTHPRLAASSLANCQRVANMHNPFNVQLCTRNNTVFGWNATSLHDVRILP